MSADDTQPVLTPTVARRIAEVAEILGPLPLGATAKLARLFVGWRAEDYAAGREQRPMSVQMPAVRPPRT